MAFPSIANSGAANSGANITGGNNWSFSFGFTATSGRLLVLICAADGNPTLTVSGWTELFQTPDSTVCKLGAWKKIATGGETSQDISPSTTEALAAVIYEITGSNGLSDVTTTTASTGSTANPNPPNLDPAGWGTEDTLWIACAGWDQNKTLSSYPASYSLGQLTSVYNNTSNGVGVGAAARERNIDQEDPGTFTISTADNSVANTIAVRTDQTVSGTSATTMGAFTSDASGAETFTGTSAQTMAAFTSSAAGDVIVPVTGTSTTTMAAFTSSASGAESFTGTASPVLDAFTSSASGSETFTGTVAQTLSDFTSNASGTHTMTVTGTVSVTLSSFTSSASGTETISGTSGQTLAAFTSTASGAEIFTGTSAQTLSAFTSTASGAESFTGTASPTLDAFTSTASGTETIGGTATPTLDAFVSTASGTETISGSATPTLSSFTSTASGTQTGGGVAGTVAVTLSAFTASASGTAGAINYDIAFSLEADHTEFDMIAEATLRRLFANAKTRYLADIEPPTFTADTEGISRYSADIDTQYTANATLGTLAADYRTFTLSVSV